MLLKFVEFLVEKLPFEVVIISNNNRVTITDNELEIIIDHDIVENGINIDFGISQYLNAKMDNIENDVKTLIHLDKLAEYLDIDLFECNVKAEINKDDMIKTRCDQLVKVWSSLRGSGNYVNKLLEIILHENAKLLRVKESQYFDCKNYKRTELFNPYNYKKNMKLLHYHKNKLNGYDLKTLYHSINSINI